MFVDVQKRGKIYEPLITLNSLNIVETCERFQTGRQGLSSVEGWELPCRIQHACEINFEF